MANQSAEASATAETSVYERYSAAAQQVEPALCCPVEYAADLLSVIPAEIIERDYGCGDPTPYVRAGDTVLDLGSGGGKLCFIAAQVVGEAGRVIGVDCNREMLGLARKHAPTVAERIGYSNTEFRYGMIQDLALDLAKLEEQLAQTPVRTSEDFIKLRAIEEELRSQHPLVADNSIDCVLSNCVLNLVRQQDRRQLFAEIHRVLRPGGRAAISDIVSDETVPDEMQRDGKLWSGCLSGAFREDEFLQAFAAAGFHGIQVVKRGVEPWQTINGIEFRSLTVVAYKGHQGRRLDRNQAVIYRGPFQSVQDDAGRVYRRGERMAVCDKTYDLLMREPYAGMFDPIEPRIEVPAERAQEFTSDGRLRTPAQTKGTNYKATLPTELPCCSPGSDCCS
ncbi:MAG: methyltransferase domain-containing protein [Planctomycetales bacterium]|nr:methyltransferase domain-containing protein [Planctomycetales bacterium]